MTHARGISRWTVAPLFAAISIALFAPGIFAGKVPVFRDLLVLMIPLRWAARSAVRSGALPLWTDDVFFGAPLLADYQSAVLYPPSTLLYALPFATGFSIFLAFHLWIAGWGMARYLESRCGVARGAAAFGGLVFCLGGFLTSLVSLTNQLVVAAWMPWALAAAEEVAAAGGRRAFSRLTLVFVLQALGGAPEALLLTVALVGAVLARELLRGRTSRRRCLAVFASLLVAAALSAAQLLPTAEYALQTDRAGGLPYQLVAAESFAPRSLLQLVVPHTFSGGAPDFVPEGSVPLFWSLYAGILPLALASTAVVLRPLGLWPIVFSAALLLALGSHTPLFPMLYHLVPGVVGIFRFPGKFFLLCHFALAVLGAQGLHEAVSHRHGRRLAAGLMAVLGVLGAGIAMAASFSPRSLLEGFGYSLPVELGGAARAVLAGRLGLVALRSVLLSSAGLAILWFLARGRIARESSLLLVSALTMLDLFWIHEPALVFTDWQTLLRSGAARARAADPGDRLFHYCAASPRCLPEGAPGLGPWSGFLRPGESVERQAHALWAALVPDAPIVYGLGAVAGSDGFSTRAQQDFFRALALLPRERAVHLLASLGVSRLIGTEPLGPLAGLADPVEDRDSATWEYALSAHAPRAYLAERVVTVPDTTAALERLADPAFRPGRDAVLTMAGESRLGSKPGGDVTNLAIEAGEIRADVASPAEALWVISDTWFPGWEAAIDGSAAEVLRVNGVERGVLVPAGAHHVEMRYRPRSFRSGLGVSTMTLAACLLFALGKRSRREGGA
jgi:hypothetical protein